MGEITVKYDIKFKAPIDEATKFLDIKIKQLHCENEVQKIKLKLKNLKLEVSSYIICEEFISKLRQESDYIEVEFSELKSNENIRDAKERTLYLLEDLREYIDNDKLKLIDYEVEFDDYTSIVIIKKILNNFYEHIKTMYLEKAHGKANITNEILDKIVIGNEYDVQRILFSIMKTIFPGAKTEVVEDAGCTSIRYDIDIESCNTTIEVKCTRDNMSERSLNEELGSDSFHYKRKNIIFFVYDKEGIISNIDSYKKSYNKVIDGKSIDIIILQPIRL